MLRPEVGEQTQNTIKEDTKKTQKEHGRFAEFTEVISVQHTDSRRNVAIVSSAFISCTTCLK